MNAISPATEQAIWFDCQGSALLGIVHGVAAPAAASPTADAATTATTQAITSTTSQATSPLATTPQAVTPQAVTPQAVTPATRGVLIVVGGPQYRVGSHRQFVRLARSLAAAGIPAFRFDCRGMGDSGGRFPGFDRLDDDIRAAIDTFVQVSGVREVVLWGLCDAATACLLYAPGDARVRGLVLANPWLPGEQSDARVMIRHYYAKRLLSRDFWHKVLRGNWAIVDSLRSAFGMVRRAHGKPAAAQPASLSARMAASWRVYAGSVRLILSGDDTVARSFMLTATTTPEWQGLLARAGIDQVALAAANHTFSRQIWRTDVETATRDFVAGLAPVGDGSSS